MKKHLLFFALGLFTTLASATDLYVREAGAGGAYSTITAAINAAANGDRIIIKPKAGAGAYVENLNINKSLTFVSETSFSRYLVTGNIVIAPLAGRVVTFSNLSLTPYGNIWDNYKISVSGATTGGRTTVNVFNSVTNLIDTNVANTTLNVSGCTSSGYQMSHGRITGNKVDFISVYSTNETSLATTDIEVIANTGGMYYEQSKYAFKALNNFFGSISVYGLKTGSSNEITNNVFYWATGTDQSPVQITPSNQTNATVAVMNNVMSMAAPLTPNMILASNAIVNASYNKSTNAFVTSGVTAESQNTGGLSMSVNATTWTVTGANVNAGNPADDYRDLDLSINDAGNFGGSNSWSNYFPTAVGNKPQVNYLSTPRVINAGTTTMSVSGSGFSK